MADFLIKNTNHWMDALSAQDVQTRIDAEKAASTEDPPVSPFEQSYLSRYQRGDVIEVGPDNRWHNRQHGGGKFLIVRAPFVSLEEAQSYMIALTDEEQEDKTLFRRRYRLWFEEIGDETMQQYEVAPYVYQINTVEELFQFSQDKKRELEGNAD